MQENEKYSKLRVPTQDTCHACDIPPGCNAVDAMNLRTIFKELEGDGSSSGSVCHLKRCIFSRACYIRLLRNLKQVIDRISSNDAYTCYITEHPINCTEKVYPAALPHVDLILSTVWQLENPCVRLSTYSFGKRPEIKMVFDL